MEKSDGTEIVLTAAQLEKIIQGNSGVIYQKSITGGVDARKVPDSRCNSDTTLHDGQGNWGAPQNKWIASEGVYRGCGYARGILHFLTDVQCKTGSANGWYNFEISGLTLHGGAFECRTTGYLGGNGPVSKMSSCPYNELAFANSYCVGEKNLLAISIDLSQDLQKFNYYHACEFLLPVFHFCFELLLCAPMTTVVTLGTMCLFIAFFCCSGSWRQSQMFWN